MSNDIFLDQSFKIYKSNRPLGLLSPENESYILSNLSKYLFKTYQNKRSDLILKYKSHEEISEGLKITSSEKEYNGYTINYLLIKHSASYILQRQIIICITKIGVSRDFSTLILHKISNPGVNSFLKSLIENLDLDVPIVIKDYKLTYDYIKIILNQLFKNLASFYSNPIKDLIGDVELIYSHGSGHINENLRNIIINVPSADIGSLKANSDDFALINLINEFLFNASKIHFEKLSIIKFSSSLINLSIDGKFRISSEKIALVDTFNADKSANTFSSEHSSELSSSESQSMIENSATESMKDSLIWFLLGSVYSENSDF